MTFTAGRDRRWHYVSDTIEHIEEHNCAKGCQLGQIVYAAPDFGPGGTCPLLAQVTIEEPVEEMVDDGEVVTCLARQPIEQP